MNEECLECKCALCLQGSWRNAPARVRTPSSPVREREREKKKRKRERGEREREYLFLKGMTGALPPFSYLDFNIC
jgi:hypothetical protein